MDKSDYDREWDVRVDAILKRVAKALPKGALVRYSAYEGDAEKLPVDNLDKIAVHGRCIFVQEHDPYWGEGKNYVSAETFNPTWLQVCMLANDMIHITGDHRHVFFEGVSILREENGVKIVNIDMGS